MLPSSGLMTRASPKKFSGLFLSAAISLHWQLRHQRDHVNDNFGMEIFVPDLDS